MTNKKALFGFVSLLIVGLLVTGVVGLAAGNGPADGSCDDPLERDNDGDGILNHEDDDWTPPEDGTGYGATGEKGQGLGKGEGGYGSGKADGNCDGEGPHGNRGGGQGQGKGRK